MPFVGDARDRCVSLHVSARTCRAHELAANLRRAFSGIVSGNVRDDTAAAIERNTDRSRFNGSARIMGLLDELLASFVEQKRMKIAAGSYQPCYVIAS